MVYEILSELRALIAQTVSNIHVKELAITEDGFGVEAVFGKASGNDKRLARGLVKAFQLGRLLVIGSPTAGKTLFASPGRFVAEEDGDGHRYLVPLDETEAWRNWLDNPTDEPPPFAIRFEGTLTFAVPEVDRVVS